MRITRKVSIIIILITFSTIVLSFYVSKRIINNLSENEIKRIVDRNVGVLCEFESKMTALSASCDNLSDWIELALYKDINLQADSIDNEEEFKLEQKISESNYYNFYLINENYNVSKTLKEKYTYTNGEELNNIIQIMKNEAGNNSIDFNFDGIVSTENSQYMVTMKEIDGKNSNFKSLLVVEPLLGETYNASENFTGLVSVDKFNEDDFTDFKYIKAGEHNVFVKYTDDLIISHIKIDVYGDGGDVYLSLSEKPQIMENVKKNLNLFISVIAVIFMIANGIIYISIKAVFVNRVLQINTSVKEIISTFNLKIRIPENGGHDEISMLSRDLNSMFELLEQSTVRMKYISGHDVLTKLLNRRSIEQVGQELIDKKDEFSLAFLDLDNFKKINDSYGHNVGDCVLCMVADCLMSYKDDEMSCGRLGGDEFIILLRGKNNKKKIIHIIKDIFKRLMEDINLKEINYSIKASVGVCYFPEHGSNMAEILQNADIAMYKAKEIEGNNYCIFTELLLDSLKIENKIAEGLKNSEFEAYFQPILDLRSKTISGAEALIRWNTKNGVIPPNKFINIAKKSGYIIHIDKFVIEQSCKLIREFLDRGVDSFQISVNISFELLCERDFLSELMETIRRYNISVENIKLEITEDEVIEDFEYVVDLLRRIRECGIKVSLDDFGTGYSSFNYIKTLPLDVLKIDKSLLLDLDSDKKTENIIDTIIHLAHILKLAVTCEGVEREAQFKLLEKLDCDYIQGYYLSRPLNGNDFRKFFADYMEHSKDKEPIL